MRNLVAALTLLLSLSLWSSEVIHVTAQSAAKLLFYPEHSAPADVVPLNDTRLSAEINARVLDIPVRVGQEVDTGDLLVRLDCRDYESRLEAQQASVRALVTRLKLARAQLERARNLKKQRNISEEEVDSRETEVLALEAELVAQREAAKQALLNQDRCEIQAPFNAVVKERLASVGTLAVPGTALIHLVQLDDVEVRALVRPAEADAGAQARSIHFAYLGRRYPLRLLRAPPIVDPSTRTLEVRLGFVGDPVAPGASGRVYWRSESAYLPADLMVRRSGKLGVFLVNDSHARFQTLPEALEGQPARAELPEDALIVLQGRHNLQDGDLVALQPPEETL